VSAQDDISAGLRDKPGPPKMRPKPESVATAEMTHADLREISSRLGRVTKISWATVWASVGVLALGGVVGGVYGLVTFLGQSPNPDEAERVEYIGGLAVGLLIAVGSLVAAYFMRKERAESVHDIRTDFDKKLDDWVLPTSEEGQAG
jgi:hypothetical protein